MIKIKGAYLKKLRLKSNMTPSELAKKAGIYVRYVYFIEASEKTPSLKLMKKLADIYGVKVDDLIE